MEGVQRSTRAQAKLSSVQVAIDQMAGLLNRMIPKTYAPSGKKLDRIVDTSDSLARLIRSVRAQQVDSPDAEDNDGFDWCESLHDETQPKKHRIKPSVEEE